MFTDSQDTGLIVFLMSVAAEIGGQKTEVGEQKSENRGQRSVVRDS